MVASFEEPIELHQVIYPLQEVDQLIYYPLRLLVSWLFLF